MSKQAATLIVLIPGFPENENDSTCLPSQQLLVREFNKVYPDLQIIIVAFQYPFLSNAYRWYGNHVIPLNGQNKRKLQRILLWRKAWKKLLKLHRQHDVIGIFSCWCSECALVGKYFSRFHSLKHFIWICGQDASKQNKLVKYIRPSANSLIAISDFLVREFTKNHDVQPLHMIPIGIDTSLFNEKKVTRDVDVIAVSSLIPLKQVEIFIETVSALKIQFPQINTIICGNGPEKEKLVQLVEKMKLKDNIFFAGEMPHKNAIELMQRSKILLHPSSYEGFGAVCMEALYAGAHVISFCKPLDQDIAHWQIAKDKNEMLQYASAILNNNETDFSPVLVNDVKTSAVSIMKLFGC